MQSQDEFVAARSSRWTELERLLAGDRELHRLGGPTISRVASLYRALCADLMRARSARYAPDLDGYLNALTARAHNALYGARSFRLPDFVRLFARELPRTLRASWRFLLAAWALFTIPWAVGLVGALGSSEFAAGVLPAELLDQMARAYANGFSEGRGSAVDAGMAGFYVYNNVGIAFRCFATGILFGAGSLFFLVYNGLVIGTVTGYVMQVGHGGNLWTFLCGHAPFELTAIWISGAAGLRMGYALVETDGRSRLGSLRAQAADLARLVLGAAAMLAIAAVIEAFWSPSSLGAPVKWTASAVFTVALTLYFTLVGRRPHPASMWRRERAENVP